jgi:hypothetical protein
MKIIIFKRLVYIFLFSLILVSCSTVKKEDKITEFYESNLIWERFEIKNISFKADADISFSGTTMSATIKGKIAGKDSASLTIIGPFGITVAKAYLSNDYILFYDSFNNRYIKGNKKDFGNLKNKSIAMYIGMVSELFNLIRNEYKKPKVFSTDSTSISNITYKIVADNQFTDYVEFDKRTNLIDKIIKTRNNIDELSVKYLDFEQFENIMFPQMMEFKYSKNTELKLEFKDLKFNQDFSNIPFIFNVPSDAEKMN